ncbi:MAG TPA: hypothetical protein VMT88_10445 [Actinomycetes bacterium]|nr:hypothetical protein [Actinomycetes bacterium]
MFYCESDNLVPDGLGHTDIFLRDTVAGTTELISANEAGTRANSFSRSPVISEDGRYIPYMSAATGLVSQATVGSNAYLYDRTTDETTLPSVAAPGAYCSRERDSDSLTTPQRLPSVTPSRPDRT